MTSGANLGSPLGPPLCRYQNKESRVSAYNAYNNHQIQIPISHNSCSHLRCTVRPRRFEQCAVLALLVVHVCQLLARRMRKLLNGSTVLRTTVITPKTVIDKAA